MTGRKRPKSVRKARSLAVVREERAYSSDPHSFIFARPGVGEMVKQLGLDLRGIFEPYTATRLQVQRRNVLKDFITMAGPLHVTHIMYLTHPDTKRLDEKRTRQLMKKKLKKSKQATDESDDVGDLENVKEGDNEDPSLPTDSKNQNPRGGGVYLHLIRVPHGPSLTFSVLEYSLQRDVLSLVRRIFDSHQFTTPPLLAMTGFGSLNPSTATDANKSTQPPPPHLRLIVDMFQNMLPPLNVAKLKLNSVRRVLLISREVDAASSADATNPDDVIYLRHFHIRTENRTVSRALRRLNVGGVRLKKRKLPTTSTAASVDSTSIDGEDAFRVLHGVGPGGSGKSSGVPSLAKYSCMEDFLTKSGMLSDSGLSDALSDMEEVDLPEGVKLPTSGPMSSRQRKAAPVHGLRHLGISKTATLRLTEIGPRLTLKLIKIEEGLNTGTVLYHRWQTRTLTEVAMQAERLREREILRETRHAEHEAGRLANEAAREALREAHRLKCLKGMRHAGQLPEDDTAATPASPTERSDESEKDEEEVDTIEEPSVKSDSQDLKPKKRSKSIGGTIIGAKRKRVKFE